MRGRCRCWSICCWPLMRRPCRSSSPARRTDIRRPARSRSRWSTIADTTNAQPRRAVWNQLTAGGEPIAPPAAGLARSESIPTVESQKPQLARETIAAASKPLLGRSPADMAGQIKPEADAARRRRAASASAGTRRNRPRRSMPPKRRKPSRRPMSSRRALSPDRQPLAAPDAFPNRAMPPRRSRVFRR